MRARRLTGFLAATAAICIGLGVPLAVHAGLTFNTTMKKTHTGAFTVGGNGTYTLEVSMSSANGTLVGDTFSVTDTLPNGLSYVTAGGPSFSCSNSGQVVSCAGAPTLTQGAAADMTVVVGVGSAASPAVTNVASFRDAGNGDQTTSDNTATDVAQVAASSTSSATTSTSTSTGAPAAVTAPSVGAGSTMPWGIGLLGAGLVALLAAVVVRRRR